MNTAAEAFKNAFLRKELDLRVKTFNLLAIGGFLISVFAMIQNIALELGLVSVLGCAAAAALTLFLLFYSAKSKNYQLCYMITIFAVFFVGFAAMFINGGGSHGGMPVIFVFAVVYTINMLDGKMVFIIPALELAFYSALYIWAYYNPEMIQSFDSEWLAIMDIIICTVIVSASLGAVMLTQFKMYRRQQRTLAAVNLSKTRFLANASHEMRTPLTVVSVNIQTVMGLLKRMDGLPNDGEAQGLLRDAQAEIMRLSRMVDGMLTLNAIAESAEMKKTDLTEVLKSTAEMLRLLIEKRGNRLAVDIAEGLFVYGSADLLSQVVVNLLQNSNAHTKSGAISLCAAQSGGTITASVSDDGCGISRALLPRVFERGVSQGGTGVGLYLCKTVVESHGGAISAQSEEGRGTTVTFTLPVYQGQFGGAEE